MSFFKEVNTRSRKSMVDFLSSHFRYDTMNSWNNGTSYACNMKIYNLPVSQEVRDFLYDMLDVPDAWEEINNLIFDWSIRHNWEWKAYFNGRSGGYLVFCEGGREDGRAYALPGRGVDMGEDYATWSMADLRDRVDLVQDFDRLADNIVAEAVYLAENYDVVDEERLVPEKRKVLKERAV